MTITTDATAPLPPCPPWCQIGKDNHGYDDDPHDGGRENVRDHVIEYEDFFATTDEPVRHHGGQPHAFISISVTEKNRDGQLEFRSPTIGLAAEDFPQFTSAEFRLLAAKMVEIADRADEIAGQL